MLIWTLICSFALCVIQSDTQNISNTEIGEMSELIGNVTERQKRCELITISICRGLTYEYTRFPNFFNQQTQEEAATNLQEFVPLLRINCSSDLKFLVCSLYTPICMENYDRPLPPCRSVCERVRSACVGIMHKLGFCWPKTMDCANFPRLGDSDSLCIGESNIN